jgi:hypothetical protein
MNPKQLDADGMLSGRRLKEGETIGKVGNYNDYEHGTTYHLHFDMQVPTELGYVFVNPYMSLVSAYERLIGARGTEIKVVAKPAPAPPADAKPEIKPEIKSEAVESKAERLPPERIAVRKPPLPERRPHRRRRHVADR